MALPTFEELLDAYRKRTRPSDVIQSGAESVGQGAQLGANIAAKKEAAEAKKAWLQMQAAMLPAKQQELQARTGKETAQTTEIGKGDSVPVYTVDEKGVLHEPSGKVFTGTEVPKGAKIIRQTTAFGNPLAQQRGKQALQKDLPSNMSPTTPVGAAAQVQLAVRTGKSLIRGEGVSPQRLALASLDLARAVNRAAPSLDAQRGASFSDSVAVKLQKLHQNLTGANAQVQLPELRKEMTGIFDDLEGATKPLIKRQLDQVESLHKGMTYFPNDTEWEKIRSREMGEDFDTPDASSQPAGMTAEAFKAKWLSKK